MKLLGTRWPARALIPRSTRHAVVALIVQRPLPGTGLLKRNRQRGERGRALPPHVVAADKHGARAAPSTSPAASARYVSAMR